MTVMLHIYRWDGAKLGTYMGPRGHDFRQTEPNERAHDAFRSQELPLLTGATNLANLPASLGTAILLDLTHSTSPGRLTRSVL